MISIQDKIPLTCAIHMNDTDTMFCCEIVLPLIPMHQHASARTHTEAKKTFTILVCHIITGSHVVYHSIVSHGHTVSHPTSRQGIVGVYDIGNLQCMTNSTTVKARF